MCWHWQVPMHPSVQYLACMHQQQDGGDEFGMLFPLMVSFLMTCWLVIPAAAQCGSG
jgi:hypothetical protein